MFDPYVIGKILSFDDEIKGTQLACSSPVFLGKIPMVVAEMRANMGHWLVLDLSQRG